MKKITFLLLLNVSFLFAQKGSFTGTVKDTDGAVCLA